MGGELMNQHLDTIIIIGVLIVFMIYRRIRRNIGWQPLKSRKMTIRITIFLIIGLLFFVAGAMHPISLISDVVGILIGIILAYYSGTMTQFEQREGHWYYRPSTMIGSFVTFLFIGRIIYRIYQMYLLGQSGGFQAGQSGDVQNMNYAIGNSWGSGLILIMFAYYVFYYITILRKNYHKSGKKDIGL
jgi:hypothetical protein